MIKKYIKKPIPIEALQYTGDNVDAIQDFCGEAFVEDCILKVRTLEGIMSATNARGDYVVKGVRGEFYIYEKTIFEETYEELH